MLLEAFTHRSLNPPGQAICPSGPEDLPGATRCYRDKLSNLH